MSYIYVATSVMTFGAILFTPIRFTAKLWLFMNAERSALACVAILDPTPPPQPPQIASLLYVNTNRKLAFITAV
jgi:hypothetical protein